MIAEPNSDLPTPALVIGNNYINNLGVIRSLGRHGIPVVLLSIDRRNYARYSRYVCEKLVCPNPNISETGFVDFLLNQAKHSSEKCVVIPTNDATVLALARYKKRLEEYYILLLSDYEVVQQLVNKSKFYRLLARMSMPYPKTYFPTDISEIKSIGVEIGYPYIIKPAFMHLFDAEFHVKCFVINSRDDLKNAVQRLENKNIEVVIQEIIPGNELYSMQTYLNINSKPLAACGYDKLRQEPPDFGVGLLWKSVLRSQPDAYAQDVLQSIKYYGIAEAEFKRDPRDGQYKFLEINARTVVPNALPAGCGVDISYIAYMDTLGQYKGNPVPFHENVLWIDEVTDLRVCFRQIFKGKLGIKDMLKSLKGKKVYGTFAWDDPLPLPVTLFGNIRNYIKKHIFREKEVEYG